MWSVTTLFPAKPVRISLNCIGLSLFTAVSTSGNRNVSTSLRNEWLYTIFLREICIIFGCVISKKIFRTCYLFRRNVLILSRMTVTTRQLFFIFYIEFSFWKLFGKVSFVVIHWWKMEHRIKFSLANKCLFCQSMKPGAGLASHFSAHSNKNYLFISLHSVS